MCVHAGAYECVWVHVPVCVNVFVLCVAEWLSRQGSNALGIITPGL